MDAIEVHHRCLQGHRRRGQVGGEPRWWSLRHTRPPSIDIMTNTDPAPTPGGWGPPTVALFLAASLALALAGLVVALNAAQSGDLALGLVAAAAGAILLVTSPWSD